MSGSSVNEGFSGISTTAAGCSVCLVGRMRVVLACVALNCARRSRRADTLGGPFVASMAALCEGIGEPFGGAAGVPGGVSTVLRATRALTLKVRSGFFLGSVRGSL